MSDTVINEDILDEFHGLNLPHKSGPSCPFRQRNSSTAQATAFTESMATMRRLSDSDVRSIFECLHNNKLPPPKLKFRIVAVGPTGLKLSPPSFEFDDGLYVLLKPQRKKDRAPDYSKVPQHLRAYIMDRPPPESCPWSLSGPQFPQPTAIQQRYCYPKGKAEYASQKGGALWTMYGADGKEDLEYRLLHVYYSAKRAVNKGVSGAVSDDSYSPPAAKRTKRSYTRSGKSSTSKSKSRKNRTPRATRAVHRLPTTSPAITTSTVGSCNSPASVDTLPPPSVHCSPPTQLDISDGQSKDTRTPRSQQILVNKSMPPLTTNHNLITFDSVEDCDDALDSRRIHPVRSHEMATPYAEYFAGGHASPHSVPFGNFAGIRYSLGDHGRMPPLLQHQQLQQPQQQGHHPGEPGQHNNNITIKQQLGQPLYPSQQLNHSMLMHTSDQELQHFYFSDPLVAIPTQPSMDYFAAAAPPPPDDVAVENFANHLKTLHKRIREMIQTAPSGDQATMVSTLTSWAKHVSKEPLGSVSTSQVSEKKVTAAAAATATTTTIKKEKD